MGQKPGLSRTLLEIHGRLISEAPTLCDLRARRPSARVLCQTSLDQTFIKTVLVEFVADPNRSVATLYPAMHEGLGETGIAQDPFLDQGPEYRFHRIQARSLGAQLSTQLCSRVLSACEQGQSLRP